jgi:hydrogenase maturation protease
VVEVLHKAGPLTCELRDLGDVLTCTQQATEFAAARGCSGSEAWEISVAFSELASNVTRHGGGGRMTLEFVTSPEPGLLITAEDSGPGIADASAASEDGFSEGLVLSESVPPTLRDGLGSGLGAVRRLTDDVQIVSAPGAGTTVLAFKKLRVAGAHGPASREWGAASSAKPTLVLGLGNAILCDDGVGIKAARYIAELGPNPDMVVKEAELAGFALIDLLEGFDRAVVIDAVKLRTGKPGNVVVFESSAIEPSLHLVAGHQIDLPTALEMGRRLGRPVPSTVYIVGVQIENDTTFSESCTPDVEAAIPTAAHVALRIVAAGR